MRLGPSWRRRAVLAAALCIAAASALVPAYRTLRAWRIASDTRRRLVYLVETGGTIGEAPAASTFSADFLRIIFGDEPALLDELRRSIDRGLAEIPALYLGEVCGMIVTHRKTEDGQVKDVVAHVIGGFPLAARPPGFHRDGYFRQLIDPDLWESGNRLLGILGRDLILLGDPEIVQKHRVLLDATLSGNILPLAESLREPLYYTAVFPQPKAIVPRDLQPHIRSIVLKGYLGMYEGQNDAIVLTPSAASARHALEIFYDLKLAAELALRTRWKGTVVPTPWGPTPGPWWACELADTLEKQTTLEREENLVRVRTHYQDAMVNVVLKSLERLGRDLAAMRATMDEKMDPRLADARLQTRKPLHYWSEEHRWGPYWPIPPRDTSLVAQAQANIEAAARAPEEGEAERPGTEPTAPEEPLAPPESAPQP